MIPKKILKIIIGLFFVFLMSFVFIGNTKAAASDNVSGWAWSENIGWISFNGSNYGVNINSDGTFLLEIYR